MLKQRLLSSLVLIPIPFLAIWGGNATFLAMLFLIAALMSWEWDKMFYGKSTVLGVFLTAFSMAGLVFYVFEPLRNAFFASSLSSCPKDSCGIGISMLLPMAYTKNMYLYDGIFFLVLAIVSAVAGSILRRATRTRHHNLAGFGVFYIASTLIATWIVYSMGYFIPLLFCVWATDVGGYAFGKTIGGPKLLPSVSPKKTWAGLAGAVILATLASWLFKKYGFWNAPLWTGAAIAVISQSGDMFESWIKRKLGLKDSSGLIPGHGGIFDRIDGMIGVCMFSFAVLSVIGFVLFFQRLISG